MSEQNIVARIVRLETKVALQFKEIEKATVLAREQIEKDKTLQRTQLDHRLEGMNEFQRRMDKLEGTFATGKDVNLAVDSLDNVLRPQIESMKKLVWVGVGIAISFQFLVGLFIALLVYFKT